MLALSAVEPDRRASVLDLVCESCGSGLFRAGDETGPETVGQGLARFGESCLSDGVVLGPELEGNSVTDSCFDVAWLERKGAVTGNDEMVDCVDGAHQSGGGSEDGELHFD